jgi:hypothetical protein
MMETLVSHFQDYLNNDNLRKIGLTFDLDWAPDFVARDVFDQLEKLNLPATVFCTHPSPLLQGNYYSKIERALHPNFSCNSTQGQTPDEVMSYLKGIYSEGIGVRSHSLTFTGSHWDLFQRHGIKYESNLMLSYQPNLRPYYHHKGILRIPFVWADDNHVLYRKGFNVDDMRLYLPGLKVVIFHPINIYLNLGHDLEPMNRVKALGIPLPELTEGQIRPMVREGPGVKELFDSFLSFVVKESIDVYCLAELHSKVPHGFH